MSMESFISLIGLVLSIYIAIRLYSILRPSTTQVKSESSPIIGSDGSCRHVNTGTGTFNRLFLTDDMGEARIDLRRLDGPWSA